MGNLFKKSKKNLSFNTQTPEKKYPYGEDYFRFREQMWDMHLSGEKIKIINLANVTDMYNKEKAKGSMLKNN